jgi:uncharacterized protein YjbI with pentapeptide repeats
MSEHLSPDALARLDAALAYIDAHPQEWDQDVWVCDTGGCVAGHLVHLDSTTDWPTLVLSGGIEERAAVLLGLSMDQCDGLFHPDNTRDALTVWRQVLAGQRVVAPGADLTRARLSGADLAGANLRGASMEDARLIGTDLSGAGLSDADLIGADLRGADLRAADLTHADLRRADLFRADLRGAFLDGANLTGADLAGARMSDGQLQHA